MTPRLRTLARALMALSVPAAGFLGWVLLFAAVAGSGWAAAGLAFGLVMVLAMAVLGMLFEGDRRE